MGDPTCLETKRQIYEAVGGETSDSAGQALQEHFSQGSAQDDGVNGGWRGGGGESNSHCMLVPAGHLF